MRKNLVLLGMMGVGKSTLGKIVAKKLNLEFIDTDRAIEKEHSMKISEIFETKGETFFRNIEEKEVLKSLKKRDSVVALGGGAFINKTIRESIFSNSISIWLDLDLKILAKRVERNKKRPLLNEYNNKKKLGELYAERKNIYKLANYKIICNDTNKENITKKIISYYENQ